LRGDGPLAYARGSDSSDVAHALVRAASALMPTPGRDRLFVPHRGVEKSLDTARTSECATSSDQV